MALKYSQLGERQEESGIVRLMTVALERPELLSLAAGFTDNATLPILDVQSIVADIQSNDVEAKKVLQYGTNQGRPGLREMLARRIEQFDGKVEGTYGSENLFVTNGSQQGLYLAMLTLCDPGDIVLIEQPTYFVFLEILKGLGIEAMLLPMAADGEVDCEKTGALVDSLVESGRIDRLKALYLVSYFANPTGHSVSKEAKEKLARILVDKAPHVAYIEDAAYRDMYFEEEFDGSSVLSIADSGKLSVMYSSTLTKPFATGLKVGYGYCNDEDWLNRMLAVKGQQDFGTSNFCQAILERALQNGDFDLNLSLLRNSYQSKMETLDSVLRKELEEMGWGWVRPLGGLYLWLKAPNGLRTDFDSDFHEACLKEGVMYVPGDLCCLLYTSDAADE